MAMIAGTITVTSAVLITGTGLAKAIFDEQKVVLDDQLDDAEAGSASAPRPADPVKVQAYVTDLQDDAEAALGGSPTAEQIMAARLGALALAAPDLQSWQANDTWPNSLRVDAPPPIDRVPPYRQLAAMIVALSTGIVPYVQTNAVVNAGTFAAGGDNVTGTGTVS